MRTTRVSLLTITISALAPLLCAGVEEQHGESGSAAIPADKRASASVRTVLQYIHDLTQREEKKLIVGAG